MTPVHLERDGTARGELESPLLRSDARVAEGGALLRRYTGLNPYRGFESLSLRQASSKGVSERPRRWCDYERIPSEIEEKERVELDYLGTSCT